MKKILVAPNSFKECAYSTEAALLITKSLEKLIPDCGKNYEIVQFPISDGGDGFLNVIKNHLNTTGRNYNISSLINNCTVSCPVEYSRENKTIYAESAKAVGLNLVPAENRKPMSLNSAPLGELLLKINKDIEENGFEVNDVVIGIGGTATNDLGIGMLSVFGLKLFDSSGKELFPIPENFNGIARIEPPVIDLKFNIRIILDVENPLTGDKGAARIFAPQKGAVVSDIEKFESGFDNILNLLEVDIRTRLSLSGAGGGLAAAFQLFFKPDVISAKVFILNYLGLASKNFNFQMVITGEGILDNQTLLNKGSKIIIDYFTGKNCDIFFICGENKLYNGLEYLNIIELKNYFKNSKEAIVNFPEGIFKACREIINKK